MLLYVYYIKKKIFLIKREREECLQSLYRLGANFSRVRIIFIRTSSSCSKKKVLNDKYHSVENSPQGQSHTLW